jgi:K+:H+ antiporter
MHLRLRRAAADLGAALPLVLFPAVPYAAERHPHGASEPLFLAQIVVLLLSARLIGELMRRFGQPAVMGQLIGGMLLGPSVLGAFSPQLQHALFPVDPEQKAMVDGVAQLGILLLLLLTGMESDLTVVRRSHRAAFSVALAGMALPFLGGVLVGEILPQQLLPDPAKRLVTSLVLGTAVSVSSIKIRMPATNAPRTVFIPIALVMSAMVPAIARIAVIAGISLTNASLAQRMMRKTTRRPIVRLSSKNAATPNMVLRIESMSTRPRPAIPNAVRNHQPADRVVDNCGRDHYLADRAPQKTHFARHGNDDLRGRRGDARRHFRGDAPRILIGQSPILTGHIDEELRGLIFALFMPVFFATAGLTTDLSVLARPALLLLTVGLVGVASLGKFGGVLLGGRLGGMTSRGSLALGCGLNARGSTEIVMASIGLAAGAFNKGLFTAVVAMAVATTMSMPPMLRWALAQLPVTPEEARRLEREAFEARGFVTNIDRLLVAVDASPSGQFAARLVGLLAGARRIATTAIHLDYATPASPEEGARQALGTEIVLKQGVDAGDDAGIAGPFAVVIARGRDREPAAAAPLDILVPVTGSAVSRHGAELAIALAQASRGFITALHVPGDARARRNWRRRLGASLAPASPADAIVREVARLGDRYEVDVEGKLRDGRTAEDAILREVESGAHNLLCWG